MLLIFTVFGLIALLVLTPAAQANKLKLLGYMATAIGGAVGGGVASEAGKDIYDNSKKMMKAPETPQPLPKQSLQPLPKHKVYDISDAYWRAYTAARHCIELTAFTCTPCDMKDGVCYGRREGAIKFSAKDVK